MPIRLQLLLFGVIGNLLVAAIFVFSFGYRENIQQESSSESLLTLYDAAWYQTYNNSFESMSKCCLLYKSPSPRYATLSRMPSSA